MQSTELARQLEPGELHTWVVADYHQMIESGILTPNCPVELLEGRIVRMSPQRPFHASSVHRTNKYLSKLLGVGAASTQENRAEVRIQSPITLGDDSEPEPDIAVVFTDINEYADRHPAPKDIYLLIEVADTTLTKDRQLKSRIYAKNLVSEYWILDLQNRQVYIYRSPAGDKYQIELVLKSEENTSIQAFPDLTITLDALFPIRSSA
jgi:Uma2 family endonuclease